MMRESMTWLRKHRWTLLALLAGFALRVYFVRKQAHVEGDSLIYGDLALNMLKHHIYGVTEKLGVRSTLIRLPGYPLLMAACFAVFGMEHYSSVLYVQLVMDLATCWLLAQLARGLMGERAGLCAIWLAALCPFTANYAAAGLTETSAIFCVALAFYSIERWWACVREGTAWIWSLGFALAFAVLLRPDRLLLTFAVLPAMAWLAWHAPVRSRSLTQTVVVALIVFLPLAAWGVRNWQVFHVAQPLAPKSAADPGEFVSYGFDRWYRTWAIEFESTYDVYWNYDGSLISIGDLPARAFDSPQQRAETQQIFERYNRMTMANPAVDQAFAALAAERIEAHPLRYYVELPVLRLANMWLRPRTEMLAFPLDWWRFRAHPLASVEVAAYATLNLAYLALAAIGLWRWKRQRWTGHQALAYALVAFVLMRSAMLLTVDNSEPRYTIDCYPFVILLASFALVGKRRKNKS
jgi:4-amino-4-deoxy-L-arabinose transferase-like glycosyltransferase